MILLSFSLAQVDPISLITGLHYSVEMIEKMCPPAYFSLPYLLSLAAETIAMGTIGTVLGALIAFPLGFLSARNTSPGPVVYFVSRCFVTFFRTVPQLVYAMILVVAFGMGLIPGIAAITLATVGMLGKFFSEAVESVDPGPLEALRATGSRGIGVIRHGVIPQVSPVFMGYALFQLDSNIRDSLVIGIIGGGGLGMALYFQLNLFHFQAVAAILLVTILMIVAINRLSFYLRKGVTDGTFLQAGRRKVDLALIVLLPVGILACISAAGIDLSTIPRGIPIMLNLGEQLLHPTFRYLDAYLELMIQTMAMSVAGTTIAILLAVPLSLLAARNVTRNLIVHTLTREILSFMRGVPELVLALIFVASLGMGPFAGVLALAIQTGSVLGEFYAQAIENIDPRPMEAVESTGASLIQRIRHVILPQIMPAFASYNLFIFDRNIRMSTILGVVGAGGIGTVLEGSIRSFQFGEAAGVILISGLCTNTPSAITTISAARAAILVVKIPWNRVTSPVEPKVMTITATSDPSRNTLLKEVRKPNLLNLERSIPYGIKLMSTCLVYFGFIVPGIEPCITQDSLFQPLEAEKYQYNPDDHAQGIDRDKQDDSAAKHGNKHRQCGESGGSTTQTTLPVDRITDG